MKNIIKIIIILKYNTSNAKDKADWRREQVDLLIKLIKYKMDNFNEINKKIIMNFSKLNHYYFLFLPFYYFSKHFFFVQTSNQVYHHLKLH